MSPGKWLWVRHFEFLKPTKIPLTSLLNLTGYHKYLKAVHIQCRPMKLYKKFGHNLLVYGRNYS